ncbi:hypothetical protein O181_047917 [Austropuccinia psidii MF-1]|uniref:Uncharacterized protein n=1 Tax=Austropuccinia psidii MF-1 TaxID=1389203 RepID=A0A9Q3DYT3_9BASI|nr:hypothetical protein [Austropuccinia psidii MF-1]
MEVCNCTRCIKFQFTNEVGKTTQGVIVTWRNCNRHWKKHCQSDQLLSDLIGKAELSEPTESNDGQKYSNQDQESQKIDLCTENTFVELIRKYFLSFN